MKIKNLAIIVLMITVLMILTVKIEATTGKINSDTVKLKKDPSSSTVLDYVYKGDEVEILEQEEGWYKVKAKTEIGKVTGYISEKFIDVEENKIETPAVEVTTEPQQPEEIEVTDINSVEQPNEEIPTVKPIEKIEEEQKYTLQQEIKVKVLPLINSIEKSSVSGNIKIIEMINDWCRIESDIDSGWIRTNILKKSLTKVEEVPQEPVIEQPEEVKEQEQQPAEPIEKQPETVTSEEPKEPETVETSTETNKTGYVSADGLRVRKGPSTDTEEITSLSKNDEVQIIGQSGKWYKIDLDGKIGYVSSKYISDTKVADTTSRSGISLRNENNTQTEIKTEEVVEKKKEEAPKTEEVVEEKKEEVPKVDEKIEVEETPETPAPSTSATTGTAVVEYAKQYLGYKYVSGGASPSKGFDCSGFTSYVYKNFGVSLNRTSRDQNKNGVAVAKKDLQLGDIVIFNNDANTAIGHVGIYVGNGNFIHASNPSDGVKITTLESGYYAKRYVGARRVI